MDNRKKILCHWDLIRFITEEMFVSAVGTSGVLSACEGKRTELMIFLGKEENGTNYEVRVYKAKPTDKYVSYLADKIVRYEENDEYASFFFSTFSDGASFIELLLMLHDEYRVRPVRVINSKC